MNLVIQQHHDLQHAVDAKQLYTELGLDKSNWAKWSQRNITNNEFALEYADYVGFVQTTNGNSTQNNNVRVANNEEPLRRNSFNLKIEDELEGSHYTKNVVKNPTSTN